MRFISKYRRHKGALPILIMLALTGLGLTFSAATAAPAKNTMSASAKSTIIEEGKEIFLKGCSSCHGLNLEGGAVAPALIGVGAASVDFQVGTGRMPMQDMSQQAARKTPVYNEEQVAALAAYVGNEKPFQTEADGMIMGLRPQEQGCAQRSTCRRNQPVHCWFPPYLRNRKHSEKSP